MGNSRYYSKYYPDVYIYSIVLYCKCKHCGCMFTQGPLTQYVHMHTYVYSVISRLFCPHIVYVFSIFQMYVHTCLYLSRCVGMICIIMYHFVMYSMCRHRGFGLACICKANVGIDTFASCLWLLSHSGLGGLGYELVNRYIHTQDILQCGHSMMSYSPSTCLCAIQSKQL